MYASNVWNFLKHRKRSLKVTWKIDGKISILGSSKATVKLTEFLNKITCNFNWYRRFISHFENKKMI